MTVNSNSLAIGGAISNGTTANSLTKAGVGKLTLAGNNSYSGETTLNAGQLNINSATALGTDTFAIANGTTIDNTSGVSFGPLTNNYAQNWNGDFICWLD